MMLASVLKEVKHCLSAQKDSDPSADALTRYNLLSSDKPLFWPEIFYRYFVESTDGNRDDLLFFVRSKLSATTMTAAAAAAAAVAVAAVKANTDDDDDDDDDVPYFVMRRHHKNMPVADSNKINWTETFFLNLLVNQFEYQVTVAICSKRDSNKKMDLIEKFSYCVYGSPSKRRMDKKATRTELTYPLIYFTVDNFEELFKNIVVTPEECVCVEVVATSSTSNTDKMIQSSIFKGSVSYEALLSAYQNKQKQSLFESIFMRSKPRKVEHYLMLRGPQGKGEAQMAVSVHETVRKSPNDDHGDNYLASALNRFGLNGFDDRPPLLLKPCLTYISLPWYSMVEDLLENNITPVLDQFS